MHKRGPEVDFSLLQLSFLGLEQLVSNQAETLVLVGNRAKLPAGSSGHLEAREQHGSSS